MLASLIHYIRKYSNIPLSDDDIQLLENAFIARRWNKRQFLLREGEVCRHITFIVKGATRQYLLDAKGNEQILNLSIDNWWTSDRESFHNETPSVYNIVAWEDSDVLMLPKANGWYDKVNAIPAFSEMRKKLDDHHHMATQRRLLSSVTSTAGQRYSELVHSYPEFLRRFPQHMIASYLGITKETLSRIKNR